jgi:tRNA A-37 threonylcarbamoyl transferase component Bud32/tetratricopeptide (TPR) repeat protein
MRGRVEELFHVVADFSDDERRRYFAERKIDDRTRSEVEALIAFDLPATASLEVEIGNEAKRALARFDTKNGRCGAYELTEILGRGGMGSVYSAERADGEIAQRVAVKLLRPGMDDSLVRQRFLAERQILAALSHPNIARLIDAGHREDGQPYLVMEYVEGETIDVYTAESSIRQKIKLVLKVCAAVAYLHRNLVVHRDLKPQNILVTKDGEPKLLDFGIAKILDYTIDSTVTGYRMLTPDYASPEQVTGARVTTATDIYSLGAVLYRLLTGESPHQFQNRSVEVIAAEICQGKITPPSKLAPGVKPDLEAILMKALRVEPQERYGSIELFAEDLENFLEFRPVRARKGGVWYRTRKFVHRYWIPVMASALAVAGLSAGLAYANRERALAQRRFEDVRQLANKLFDVDVEARKVPGNTKVRQAIVDTSLEYLRRLSKDAQRDPQLQLELGNAYMRVARVQGVPISANLGQMDLAEQNLRTAETLIQSSLAARPANRTALLRAAQIAHDRMLLTRFANRNDDSLDWARRSAAWLHKLNPGPADKPEAPAILVTYLNVADQYMLGGKYDEALRLCREASDLARSYGSPLYIGTFHWVSGQVYRREGDLQQALKETEESVRTLEPVLEKKDQGAIMNFVLALTYRGRILGEADGISMGRVDEALADLDRAFTICDSHVHQDPNDQAARGRVATAGLAMGGILRHSNPGRALAVYDHVLDHTKEIKDNSSFRRYEVSALAGSSYALREMGRPAEARQRLDAAFERLRQLGSYPANKIKPGSEVDVALAALADFEGANGNPQQGAATAQKLLDAMVAWGPAPESRLTEAVDISRIYALLENLQRSAGDSAAASGLHARRIALWQQWDTKLPSNPFIRRQLDAARH